MKRRDFLKFLGAAAAGGVIAKAAPAIAPVVVEAAPVAAVPQGIRGLAYIVAESGTYFGTTRTAHPSLKAAFDRLDGAGLLT